MQQVLYLFPDTNVFLHCKPLDQTSWQAFGRWERIEVVVTRPVQTEIDALKGNGNGRRAAKARAATSLLRKLLEVDPPTIVLSSSPLVQLTVRLDLRTEAFVSDLLNYESKDDQLVGTALAFQRGHSEFTACLLTDDTGVMFSARAVGVQYRGIPPEWLLQTEPDEADRREKALREQLAAYEKSEPQFSIDLSANIVDLERMTQEPLLTATRPHKMARPGGSTPAFKATLTKYTPLSEDEIDALVAKLVEHRPQATEFGPSEPQERAVAEGLLLADVRGRFKEVFTPASPEKIDAYKAAYQGWVQNCKDWLQTFHEALNAQVKWPSLAVTISNNGSRPAADTLVRIESFGKLTLLRPCTGQDGADEPADEIVRLPTPPTVPRGQWKTIQISRGLLAGTLGQDMASRFVHVPEPIQQSSYRLPTEVDPNGVYWKLGSHELPTVSCELTCTQWRHAIDPVEIHLCLVLPVEAGTHSGQVTVTVHAANLTAPAKASLPVRLVVEEASCAALAAELVESTRPSTSGLRLNLPPR